MARADVDGFIAALASPWQRRRCLTMLEDIRHLPQPLDESLKWGNPHFDGRRAVLKWYCATSWINVYFYRGDLLEDPRGCFEPTDNSRMRAIKITEEGRLDRPGFRELLHAAVLIDAGAS